MFQFTTTNVVNSLTENGKSIFTVLNETDERGATLNIKRVNNFCKDFVTDIFKREGTAAKPAKAVVDLDTIGTKVTEGDTLRLNMYIGLTEGSNFSLYANDGYYKGKPFIVEFIWKGDDTAETLVKTINKFMLNVHGEKMVDVTYAGNVLTITGVNGYQKFVKVDIEKLDRGAYNGMGEYNVIASATVTDGEEGFGTYEWILHNLRLPTCAHTRFGAINAQENPIPGAMYNQYTIHYCVNRGTLGTNAVGDQVTSHTTHVFYVKSDLASEFETLIQTIGEMKTV